MTNNILRGALLAAVLAAPAANAQLSIYEQNFEGLDQASGAALANDGWLVFGNVFAPDGTTFLFGYGPFVAPNTQGDGAAFSNIAAEQGGPDQGLQQLVVFSDYNNNAAHSAGNIVESNVFQEFTIGPADIGSTWEFSFDAKKGDISGISTAIAFIKTLDPANGFALTNFINIDTTALPETWGRYTLSIDLSDPALQGQLLQIGFATTTTSFTPSGVFYDNILFAQPSVDTDGDGVADDVDNCTEVANADQRDTNGDGFGNACDADLNNDGVINVSDLGLLRAVFFTNDADADFNGDNVVNVSDLGIMRASFFGPPGPAGI